MNRKLALVWKGNNFIRKNNTSRRKAKISKSMIFSEPQLRKDEVNEDNKI